jgi:uncharacterized protein YcaQ
VPLSTLTISQVRLVQLAAQGLLLPPAQPAAKADVLAAIQRMGVLQIDTISVVARSPYLVLFSRLGTYDPAWLEELLAEGAIFENWAHAACFIPIEDFPLIRRTMLEQSHSSYFGNWAERNKPTLDHVLDSVRQNGSMRSADFASEKSPGGWWNWKSEKIALEYWLMRGDLMVARRDKFQRVYDLRERILPNWDDARAPSVREMQREFVRKSVRAMGIARRQWVWDYYRLKKKLAVEIVDELVSEGSLYQVAVEGWQEPALFAPEDEPLLHQAAAGELTASHTTLLSPFDPLTWDRERARQLFGFDFTIQAYTPAAKRQYGYFPLPILHHGALVGRVDAKAHRKEGIFEVKGLFLEETSVPSVELASALAAAIRSCASWHQTPHVILRQCAPGEFQPLLEQALSSD